MKKNFTEYCEKYCKFLFQSVLFYEISTPVLIFLKPYFSWKFSSFFILLTFSSLKKAILSKNESWSCHFASHNIEGTILEKSFLKDTPIRIVRSVCKTDVIVITEVVINESHYDYRSHYYPTENFNLTTKTKACFASHLHLDLVSVLVHYPRFIN